MKKDLNILMVREDVDAIFAMGSPVRDPTMFYLLNGVKVSGFYVKKKNHSAYLIHHPMEREEAKKTRLKLINISQYRVWEIYNRYPDKIKAEAVLINTILEDFKVRGRVAFYGNRDWGSGYNLLKRIRNLNKNIEILYEPKKSLISEARMTKDKEEIDRIKRARDGVVSAFNETIKAVQKMEVKNGMIYKERHRQLFIRDLKEMLSKRLFENGLINSSGLIVAQARDAGIPHNSGENDEPVKLGKTIVFDIFPQEIDGGYYFDFTRTICFGKAPEEIKKEYTIVKEAQELAIENLKIGRRTTEIEIAVCNFFEKNGHSTPLTNPKTQKGYCHSLGHGLGLNVHEGPEFGLSKTNYDRLEPGMVFTIEPGLYYPEKGYGIRLEDVIYLDQNGKVIDLTKFPKKLEVEI